MKRALLTALLFSALFAGNAFAGFIINVEQVGADLKFSYSGSMVMAGSGSESDAVGYGYGQNTNDIFRVWGGGTTGNWEGVVTPTFSNRSDFLSGSGTALGASLASGSTNFLVRTTATANTLRFSLGSVGAGTKTVSGSFTVASRTLASIGYTANTSRTWSWTENGQSFVAGNTLTINAVPEPSSIAVVGGLVAGLSVLSRRRRQA
jgi:hypothetical protein